jgi:formylglycine-generating enzyme required for sulfatase activity
MALRMLCLALFASVVLIACTTPRAPVSKLTQFRDCPDCPAMVRVPAGTFQMGDASSVARPDEQPVRPVSIAAFAVGRYEVTVAEYAAFTTATGRETRPGCRTDRNQDGRWENDPVATWREPGFPQTDRHPVVCVSWADGNAYVAWLTLKTGKTYRLLSEAEWEYAARAGSTTQFWWGDNANDLCGYANGPDLAAKEKFPGWTTATCNDGQALAAPVGTYEPNAFGLYDMAGNVWEWTQECYDGACQRRVLRGGSWVYGLQDLRSSQRNALPPPWIHGGDIGFRVARYEGEIDQAGQGR